MIQKDCVNLTTTLLFNINCFIPYNLIFSAKATLYQDCFNIATCSTDCPAPGHDRLTHLWPCHCTRVFTLRLKLEH